MDEDSTRWQDDTDTVEDFESNEGKDDIIPMEEEPKIGRPRLLSVAVTKWNPLMENEPTLQDFFVHGVDDLTVSPEGLTTEELERCLTVMLQSNTTVKAENNLLEAYLTAVDPILIDNMEKILEAATVAIQKAERTVQLGMMASVTTSQTPRDSSATSPRSTGHSQGASSGKVAAFAISDKGPKVQPQQKIEIVQREMDNLKSEHDEVEAQAEKTIFKLECQKEAHSLDYAELDTIQKEFEHSLANTWVHPVTRKVPGEQIISFLESRNRLDAHLIATLKTKIKNFKIRQKAANNKIQEIGDVLHFVDYEQLMIEAKEAQKNLNDSILAFSELKKANAKYLPQLNNVRSLKSEKITKLGQLIQLVKDTEGKIAAIEREEEEVKRAIKRWNQKIRKIQERFKQYTAPSVMDYIIHKSEISQVSEALKTLQRKSKIFDAEQIIKMKNHGNSSPNKTFEEKQSTRPRLYTRSKYWSPPNYTSGEYERSLLQE